MAPGSVIVDLAAERGGNCELTHMGETAVEHGVTIIGSINLASTVPYHASQMYAKNLTNFLLNMVKDGQLRPQHGRRDRTQHSRHARRRDREPAHPRIFLVAGISNAVVRNHEPQRH